MTIQEFGGIDGLVGGAAEIATLIYLAVQLKQNTQTVENARATVLCVAVGRRSFDMQLDRIRVG